MRDEIVKFLLDNLNNLGYLCIPLGMIYSGWRRLVGDNRTDRRENQQDTFVRQLSERLREMQVRGDKALEEKSQLIAESHLLNSTISENKRTISTLEDVIADIKKQLELLQFDHRVLQESHNALLTSTTTHPRRGGRQ